MTTRRAVRVGIAFATAGVVASVLTFAAPAWAHVEVSADKPQAGATNVTVTFTGEAESNTAGITSERVVLPAGITPDQVRAGTAPKGWKLSKAADGFTLAGPALPVGADAEFSVVIDQLPTDATQLPFKTIETYTDGKVSRWIEVPKDGQPEPDNPAPVLTVRAAPAAPSPSATATSAPATTVAPTTAGPATSMSQAAAAGDDTGTPTGLWIAVAVVVAAAAAATVVMARRRRR